VVVGDRRPSEPLTEQDSAGAGAWSIEGRTGAWCWHSTSGNLVDRGTGARANWSARIDRDLRCSCGGAPPGPTSFRPRTLGPGGCKKLVGARRWETALASWGQGRIATGPLENTLGQGDSGRPPYPPGCAAGKQPRHPVRPPQATARATGRFRAVHDRFSRGRLTGRFLERRLARDVSGSRAARSGSTCGCAKKRARPKRRLEWRGLTRVDCASTDLECVPTAGIRRISPGPPPARHFNSRPRPMTFVTIQPQDGRRAAAGCGGGLVSGDRRGHCGRGGPRTEPVWWQAGASTRVSRGPPRRCSKRVRPRSSQTGPQSRGRRFQDEFGSGAVGRPP